jgi:predicted nucleic acid-binding protein
MAKDKSKIYLDTSVLSVLHDKRDQKLHQATRNFWKFLSNYEIYISQIVIDEISITPDKSKKMLLERTIEDFVVLEINNEVENLVKEYMRQCLVPEKDKSDAYHVAVATVYKSEYLVTWNLEHLAKEITRHKVIAVNLLQGYKEVRIVTPYDLLL